MSILGNVFIALVAFIIIAGSLYVSKSMARLWIKRSKEEKEIEAKYNALPVYKSEIAVFVVILIIMAFAFLAMLGAINK